jgi:hypothetical protein
VAESLPVEGRGEETTPSPFLNLLHD